MKRILSWVLAMVLLLSCMPAGAVQAESLTQTVQPQPVQEVAAPEETTAFTAVSAVAAEPESLDIRQLLRQVTPVSQLSAKGSSVTVK